MLFIVLLFGAFLVGLAMAPRETVQLCLAALWVVMAAGCTATVIQAALR